MPNKVEVIHEPGVFLLSKMTTDERGVCQLLEDAGAVGWQSDAKSHQEAMVEMAGRSCYQSWPSPRPGGNKTYIHHIIEAGHGSVLEVAVWGFAFVGVSRSFTHELVRHRTLSFSQLSQRYVDETLKVKCVVPQSVADDPVSLQIWLDAVQASNDAYQALVRRQLEVIFDKASVVKGIGPHTIWPPDLFTREERTAMRKEARGAARSVLPNAQETKIVVTGNARSWRNVIEQRCSPFADREIRVAVYKVWEILKREAPALFSDYTEQPLADGSVALSTPYRKV